MDINKARALFFEEAYEQCDNLEHALLLQRQRLECKAVVNVLDVNISQDVGAGVVQLRGHLVELVRQRDLHHHATHRKPRSVVKVCLIHAVGVAGFIQQAVELSEIFDSGVFHIRCLRFLLLY